LVRRAQRVGRPKRMDLREPQRLVCVDVADAGEERLVEKEGLQPGVAPTQKASEVAERERGIEGLGAETAERRQAVDLATQLARYGVTTIQPDPTELPDVAEAQLAAVVELEHEPDVGILARRRRNDEELARHLEVDRQGGR